MQLCSFLQRLQIFKRITTTFYLKTALRTNTHCCYSMKYCRNWWHTLLVAILKLVLTSQVYDDIDFSHVVWFNYLKRETRLQSSRLEQTFLIFILKCIWWDKTSKAIFLFLQKFSFKDRGRLVTSHKNITFLLLLYKLFHSVLDQIISRWITAHYSIRRKTARTLLIKDYANSLTNTPFITQIAHVTLFFDHLPCLGFLPFLIPWIGVLLSKGDCLDWVRGLKPQPINIVSGKYCHPAPFPL